MKQVTIKSLPEKFCLNDQTAGNLKRYLDTFPDDAKVVISGLDRCGAYNHFDCVIGCNIEFQREHNRVVLTQGMVVEPVVQ